MKYLQIRTERKNYYPGEEVRGAVDFTTQDPVKIRGITLVLQGVERTYVLVSSMDNDVDNRKVFKKQKVTISGKQKLSPGTHTFHFKFRINTNAIPSHNGQNAKISYVLIANVDVPWAFDVKKQKSIRIFYPRDIVDKNAMAVSTTDVSESSIHKVVDFLIPGEQKAIEVTVSLPRNCYFTGEEITGTVLISNPERRSMRTLRSTLRAKEIAKAYYWEESSFGHGINTRKTCKKQKSLISLLSKFQIQDDAQDIFIPFSFLIPRGSPSTYKAELSKVVWTLEFKLDTEYRIDRIIKVPIMVFNWF